MTPSARRPAVRGENRSKRAVRAKSDKSPDAFSARSDCAHANAPGRPALAEATLQSLRRAAGHFRCASARFGRLAEPISRREWLAVARTSRSVLPARLPADGLAILAMVRTARDRRR